MAREEYGAAINLKTHEVNLKEAEKLRKEISLKDY